MKSKAETIMLYTERFVELVKTASESTESKVAGQSKDGKPQKQN